MNKNNKGFTLIELLVVIAIIGILASVVLTQVNSARDKTLDVAIKSDLDGIRSASVVLYDTLRNSYGETAVTGADCDVSTNQPSGTIFADTNIKLALAHIKKSNGGVQNTADTAKLYCNLAVANGVGTGYAIVAKLKSTPDKWVCLDGTGQLKTTTGVGSVAYTGVMGTDSGALYYALASNSDTDCN